jgi:FixJ family two-component response regulator
MMIMGRKVLVVEDDDSLRAAIARLLRVAGFECTAYVSAEALLADAPGEDVVCLVSDLKLPGMSGLELLPELRTRGELAPFILITAYDEPGLSEKAARCGAAGFLVKPFSGTELLNTIKALTAPTGPL